MGSEEYLLQQGYFQLEGWTPKCWTTVKDLTNLKCMRHSAKISLSLCFSTMLNIYSPFIPYPWSHILHFEKTYPQVMWQLRHIHLNTSSSVTLACNMSVMLCPQGRRYLTFQAKVTCTHIYNLAASELKVWLRSRRLQVPLMLAEHEVLWNSTG